MTRTIKTASLVAAVAAAILLPATFAEAGGNRGKKAKPNGANTSQMMRLGGPRSNNSRASNNGRTFDQANTGYGEYGSIAFANGEQRFDGVSVRQLFLKRSQDGSGG
jgi:hypothetical protein